MTSMYDALSVAHHVITCCNKQGDWISNLKLQPILYFIQAEFLVTSNYPCFKDELKALDFGAVVPSVHNQYNLFGAAPIPLNLCKSLIPYYASISINDKIMIDTVISVAMQYTASQLAQIVRNQAPWKNAYRRGSGSVISNNSILNYFST